MTGTREPSMPAHDGHGQSAETGDGRIEGQELPGSRSTGKPCTGRREAGSRYACEAGGRTVRGHGPTGRQSLAPTCNASCISGVGKTPSEAFRDLWNWVTDPRNLRCAWARVASNRGKQTAGIDGMTVGKIRREKGENAFLDELRQQLRKAGSIRPSPCRRKLIPKRGKPGEFRPLGIPTIDGPHGTMCGQADPGADP